MEETTAVGDVAFCDRTVRGKQASQIFSGDAAGQAAHEYLRGGLAAALLSMYAVLPVRLKKGGFSYHS